MKVPSEISKRFDQSLVYLLFFVLLFLSICMPHDAIAQTIDHKETAVILQKTVHLKLGETTLAKTLEEISKQTGLQIQAVDYLKDRELLVELDNMDARAALDTLAESNDWIWYEAKQNSIFMARPAFNKTQQLANVAPALRIIVPKDLRRFIGLDVSDADFSSAFRQSLPNSKFSSNDPSKTKLLVPRFRLTPERLQTPVTELENQMVSWVTDEVKKGKRIPYAKLTLQQQHSLLTLFVFKALHTIFSPGSMGALKLVTGIDPADVNETQMQVIYKDGAIFIGTLQGGRTTYGEGIMSEKQLPDPLLLHTPL